MLESETFWTCDRDDGGVIVVRALVIEELTCFYVRDQFVVSFHLTLDSAFIDSHTIVSVVGDMELLFVVFEADITMVTNVERRFHGGGETAHLLDFYLFFLVHKNRKHEFPLHKGCSHFLSHHFIDNLVHVLQAEISIKSATYHIVYFAVLLNGTIVGVFVQTASCTVSLGLFFPVRSEHHTAGFLGHVVGGVVNHNEFFTDLLEVLCEGFPGLGKDGFFTSTFAIVKHVVMELSHLIDFILSNAGNDDGINAVVGVVVA